MEKRIKSIKTYIISNNSQKDRVLSSIKEYDEKSKLILFKEFDEDQVLTFEQRSLYNDRSQLINESKIDNIDGYTETTTKTYTEDGTLLSERIDNDCGWWYIKSYDIDKTNRITTICTYDEDDNIEEKVILKLNEKGVIISQTDIDENDVVKEITEYEYNDIDLLVSRVQYIDKKKPERFSNYFYDENNNITDIQVLNRKEKLIDWIKFSYNENNDLIEQVNMSGSRKTIEYKDDNNTIIETSYNKGGEILETETSYKNADGMIIKEESLSSEFVKEYEYEYF